MQQKKQRKAEEARREQARWNCVDKLLVSSRQNQKQQDRTNKVIKIIRNEVDNLRKDSNSPFSADQLNKILKFTITNKMDIYLEFERINFAEHGVSGLLAKILELLI